MKIKIPLENNPIRKVRLENRLSQKEFADKLGVHKQNVTQWESGRYGISIRNLRKIENRFKTRIEI